MSGTAVTSGAPPPVRVRPPQAAISRLGTGSAPALRAAAAVALLLVLWSCTPPAEPQFRLCGFHWLTGRDCPLCGMTRAVFALAKGHWREALGFNALSPLGFAMLFSVFWDHSLRGRLWRVGIAAFAVYGVLRVFFAGV
jgi:hypothetical protein